MKKLIIPPVFVFLCLAGIVAWYLIFPALNVLPFPVNLLGLLISFSGFVIMGQARDLFRKHKTSLDITSPAYFVKEGIYARSRNPMYLGMLLLIIGIGVCFGNLVSMITPFGFWLLIHFVIIPREEVLMQQAFGHEYMEYKSRVNKWC